jgi:hypothetical protein
MGRQQIRQLETPVLSSSDVKPYQVKSGYVLVALAITISGQLTCTSGNNTIANLKRGDEWGWLKRLTLKANEDLRVNVTGDELWWLNRHWTGRTPKLSVQLGNGSANPTFKSTLLLPFAMPRSQRPQDTYLDTSRYQNVEMEFTTGTFTDISNGATAFTVNPSVTVVAVEDTGRRGDQFWNRYLLRRESDISAANSDFRHLLGVDKTYRRLFVNTRDSSGNDSASIANRLKLFSGALNFTDGPAYDLRETFDLFHATPDFFDPSTGATVSGQTVTGSNVSTGTITINSGDYATIRQNTINAIGGWTTLDFALDGGLSSGIDTYGFTDFSLGVDAAAAGKIVTIEETVAVPRKTA